MNDALKIVYCSTIIVFEFNRIREMLFGELNAYGEKCKVFTHSKDAMKFIAEVYNDTPII